MGKNTAKKLEELEMWHGGDRSKVISAAIDLLHKTEQKTTEDGPWMVGGKNIEDGPSDEIEAGL